MATPLIPDFETYKRVCSDMLGRPLTPREDQVAREGFKNGTPAADVDFSLEEEETGDNY